MNLSIFIIIDRIDRKEGDLYILTKQNIFDNFIINETLLSFRY